MDKPPVNPKQFRKQKDNHISDGNWILYTMHFSDKYEGGYVGVDITPENPYTMKKLKRRG